MLADAAGEDARQPQPGRDALLENSLTELRFRYVQVADSGRVEWLRPDGLAITVLGSGTSVGVPTIGCHCAVCTFDGSARQAGCAPPFWCSYGGRNVVIDTTPDFRGQVLRAGLERLDAILFTHAHADHIMGLDDVRPFNYRQRTGIPVYGAPETIETRAARLPATCSRTWRTIRTCRAWRPTRSTARRSTCSAWSSRRCRSMHGSTRVFGYRFGNAAYLTDHSDIPAASLELLRGLDVLFLDALRHRPHPTHTTVERALASTWRS